MDEMFKGVAESTLAETNAAAAQRTFEKSKTLDALFAKHTDGIGNLSPAFYRDAEAAGLGRAELEQAADYAAKQKAVGVSNAQNDTILRALGYQPQAAGRSGAGFGAPEPQRLSSPSLDGAGAGAPLGPSSIDPDRLRSPSEVGTPQTSTSMRGDATEASGDGSQTMGTVVWEWLNSGDKAKVKQGQAAVGLSGKDQDGIAGPKTARAFFQAAHANGWKSWSDQGRQDGVDGTVQVQGSAPASKGEEARLAPDTVAPDVFAPVEDSRSWYQKLEDSYDPSKAAGAGMASASVPEQGNSLFAWNPTNEGNQFRAFNDALSAKLNAAGISSPSEYLQRVYQAGFKANLPAPPNQALLGQGYEGVVKYNQQLAEYQAGIQKAQGAGEKAVMDARDKLESMAKEYGTSTVEDRKSYVGQGYILRDASKRDVANALLVNRDNINHAVKSVDSAGLDKTKLTLALPQLVRAYATSLNPGQQLSEGSLAEVTAMALPELADKKDMIRNLAVGIFNAMRGKTDVLQDIANGADAQTAAALRSAMTRIAGELPGLNEKALGNYVIPPKGAKPFKYARVGEAGASLPRVTSQAQYDALKVGAEYVGPDGVKHKKGGN